MIANSGLARNYWRSYWEARTRRFVEAGEPAPAWDPSIRATMLTNADDGRYLMICLQADLSRREPHRLHSLFKVSQEWGSLSYYVDVKEGDLHTARVFALRTYKVEA